MSEENLKEQYTEGAAIKESSLELNDELPVTWSQKWTNFINAIRAPINQIILGITNHAAIHPWAYIVSIVLISFTLIVTGLFTNFNVDVDEDTLWTPRNSRSLSHGTWVDEESGFDKLPRYIQCLIHRNGANVLGVEGVRRSFAVLDLIRNAEGYQSLCDKADHIDFNGVKTCPVSSVTNFWNDTQLYFEAGISTDDQAIVTMSEPVYPNNAPVEKQLIMGRAVVGEDGILTSAQSLILRVLWPDIDEAPELEKVVLERMFDLQDEWLADKENDFVLQIFTERSFSDEFTRAIVNDIPLVPVVFVIMSIFTCLVYWRRDWVFSRCLLGLGAVCTVFLAIMTGYGIMFIAGVPFTSMTQILPFIMFGIGLDNAYIISGEYGRTDKRKPTVHRIHDTMDEVGLSIFLTTSTSVIAFALGCTSQVPAVFWLCQYATPTIFINFVYQLTFFIALTVIDEKRVAEKRRDCLVCLTMTSRVGIVEEEETSTELSWVDRIMGWYADVLFHPFIAAFVVAAFTGLFIGCAYSASLLTQDFKFTDVVPKDSYVADFWDQFVIFSERSGINPVIFFRDVDQCDPSIQQQMEDYVNDLVAMDEISEQPMFFWLRDFKSFVTSSGIQNLTCPEQVDAFLANPVYNEIYRHQIVRDEDGNITASQTLIQMDNVNQESVEMQVDALRNQDEVTAAQPVNEGRKDWAFFTFDSIYHIWGFYARAPVELTQTTVAGVAAVSVLGFALIPHWTAVLFVAPMISILYIDLLGFLQFAGIAVNAVSYISLVMSIGLLVDFLMHILLRYYESNKNGRKAKVKDTLQSMGASILIGAISTFLGVIPLAFSSSSVFKTIFVTFVGLVILGAGHGLILIPVLLSLVGPNVCIKEEKTNLVQSISRTEESSGLECSASGGYQDKIDVLESRLSEYTA